MLPAPSEHPRLNFGGQFGLVYRINFKGHSVSAKVCDIADVVGYSEALLRVVAAPVVSASDHVLRLLDVVVMKGPSGQRCIAIIYPPMDCTLRTWCLPRRRPIAQQEYRHIAWSVLLGIRHLHSLELVHADLTPGNVQLKGAGFAESAINFNEFCQYPLIARNYVRQAAMLKVTLLVCIADSGFCVPGSSRNKLYV